MRDLAVRATRIHALQTALYWAQFVIALAVLSFPLSVYSDFIREHRYGLSNLSFAAWIGEELKGLAISIVLGAFAMTALYAIVRRLPRTWWIWGAAVSIAFAAFGALIAPVLIVTFFYNPKKLQDAALVVPHYSSG